MGNHRAARSTRSRVTGSTPVGKRRASTASRARFPRFPLSAPILVGVTALALAAGGAVSVGSGSTTDNLSLTQAGILNGTDALTGTDAVMDNRQAAVSRDSQRQALADAADQELQAAAEAQARQRNAALAALANSAEKYASKIAAHAWVLPVNPLLYHLTARFGYASGLWVSTHTGLDFAAPEGTAVMSIANGTVTDSGYDGSYGNRIIVTLNDGTEVWYCHLSAYAVATGDAVRGGQVIGAIGSTGNVTGPHLHLEVRPGAGDPVDPYAALVYHGLRP